MIKLLLFCGFLFGSLDAIGRNPDILLRGSGVLTKFINQSSHQATENFVATVVLNTKGYKTLQLGYKAVFPDGREKTLALEITDSLDEKSASLHASSDLNQDELSRISSAITELEDGYQILFKKGHWSRLEVIVKFIETKGNHGVADVKVDITTNEWATTFFTTDDNNPMESSWKIDARIDFNALMRHDDNSHEELVEELFGN